MILSLFITAFYTTYRLSIMDDDIFWFDISLDFIFGSVYLNNHILAFDIIVNFLTSFYDNNNNLQTSFKRIAKNYFQGWLFIDILSVLPFYIIGNNWELLEILELFRFTRSIRIQK